MDIPKKKTKMSVARMVSVPISLHLEMSKYEDVNWSAVAQKAWSRAVEQLKEEALRKKRRK